jgi:putative heme-binding domain-containing protein
LELFATGTRNILGTPVSPLLDIFARDNTNDGGGWDVRFHHFTGLEDHGYPRLYKNFSSEYIAPLADYGGGSGCGSTYLSEPGFPSEWNHAPMTCDWGTGALWRHSVESAGATFIEKAPPQKFIAMTRPTDADVDGMSAVYQASWKGATFDWAGADSGYIVRVTPKEYTPQPLPNFEALGDAQLISMLASESQVRSMAAQRTLVRRAKNSNIIEGLAAFAANPTQPLQARVAALYAITQIGITQKDSHASVNAIGSLASDPSLLRFAARALGDFFDRSESLKQKPVVDTVLAKTILSSDHRTALEGIVAATRLNRGDLASTIAKQLGAGDPVLHHTAFQCLAKLEAFAACFEVIDALGTSQPQREGAFLALMRIHRAEVVNGLVKRLGNEQTLERKKGILNALCRLHSKEGEWKRDSWGTRPDNRGPYYQPESWEQTKAIASALQSHLIHASSEEAAHLVAEMNRNRIQSQEALTRIIELAKSDVSLIPDAVAQLASCEAPPAEGILLLNRAAKDPNSKPTTLSQAVQAIVKTDNADAWKQVLPAMVSLAQAKGSGKEQDAAQSALMGAAKLENVHQLIEKEAEAQLGNPIGIWADAILLNLSARKSGSPEAREMASKALDAGWNQIERRIQIIRAADKIKAHTIDDKIQAAMQDPDKRVANAASSAAKSLRLKVAENDTTPKVGLLNPDQALAQVLKTKGDKGLGEQIFAKATCVACHTVSQQQAQKGPYLGNIAQTYNRNDLAANILDPNRTIAQGFATNMVTLDTGATHMGFVTDESGDKLTIRDIASQEFTFLKSKITSRATLPNSMMPLGLMSGFSVLEFASLLEYLESLSKN